MLYLDQSQCCDHQTFICGKFCKTQNMGFLVMQKDMLMERTCWSNYYLKESNIPFFSMLQQPSLEDELSYAAGLALSTKANTEESKERERKKYTNISSEPFLQALSFILNCTCIFLENFYTCTTHIFIGEKCHCITQKLMN